MSFINALLKNPNCERKFSMKSKKFIFVKSVCPLCNKGVAPCETDAIVIMTNDGEKLICGRHFANLLPRLGISYADLKYLHQVILDAVPTIHYVFLYALALSLKNESALLASQSKRKVRQKVTVADICRPLKVVEIPADKDLPGVKIVISLVGRPDSSKRKRFPKCNFIRSEKIIKLSARFKINSNLTTALRWAEYLSRIQPPTKHIHGFIPRLTNHPIKIADFAKQKLIVA